jgi:uncharacterized protein YjiS (DUF1127 family)
MTTASGTARHPHLLATLFARLADLPAFFYEHQRKRAVYRRTLDELATYRPHELRDLGITAGDVEAIARKQAGL